MERRGFEVDLTFRACRGRFGICIEETPSVAGGVPPPRPPRVRIASVPVVL